MVGTSALRTQAIVALWAEDNFLIMLHSADMTIMLWN
jgi:hypothetical protein